MNRKVIVIAILLIFIAGCAPKIAELPERSPIILPHPSEADPEGKLIFSLGGEVSVLNPILYTDTASAGVCGVVFSGMVRINENLEVIPDMAKSWEISEDGLVWTFHLRKGIKWHDGKPFTAEDVKFTFDSILNPRVNSVRRSDYIINGQPIKFKVVDPHTVQAILPKAFAPFLVNVGMSIIPKHLYQGTDINRSPYNRRPIGTGPFIFKEWVGGDHVMVTRNPEFYGGRPKLSEIIFRVIPDENARVVALETGEVDETNIPPKDYERMKGVAGINVFEYDALTYTYLGFNLGKPLFQDKRVRQALAYATNKSQLVKLIFKGLASPAYSPSAPVSWAYSEDVAKYPHSTQKAKGLLAEAGWKVRPNGILEKDGKSFEFTVLVNQGNREREKAAIILQQQFRKIGIKLNIRIMEWSAMLKILNASKDPKDFDAVIIGWSLGIDPDDYSIWHSSQYPRGLNFIKYENPKVDSLLELGRTTMKKGKRKKIYAQINKIIAEDQPYIFLWYPKAIVGVRDRVGGLSKPGPAGLFLYIEKVFVKK